MIDGFTPQPYPLECSTDDGATWLLVIGWREPTPRQLVPVLATDGGLQPAPDAQELHFRLPSQAAAPRTGRAPSPQAGSSSEGLRSH